MLFIHLGWLPVYTIGSANIYQVSRRINVTVKHIGSLRVSTLKVYIHIYTENFSIHYYCLPHGVGIPRKLRAAFCHCEPDIVALVQLNFGLLRPLVQALHSRFLYLTGCKLYYWSVKCRFKIFQMLLSLLLLPSMAR